MLAYFPPGGDRWLFGLCLSRVGAFMVYISYAAALPVLQREWQMSGTAAGSIASAFQIAYAVSLLVSSELADRVGARRVFLASSGASAVGAMLFAAFARDYWSGLLWYTLLALALGGTYTTGILLVADNIPVTRRGRAMGFLLGGHSLGLALALAITGMAIPRGGYRLAFFLTCLGPVLGGILVWAVTRDTPNQVAQRTAAERLTGAVLRNRPAMVVITGYTCHSWELLGMWAWTPAFLAACFVAAGSGATNAAGLGSYVSSLFHITGMLASLIAGVVADRFGRTPVIFAMATLSTMCSIGFGWLTGGRSGSWSRWGWSTASRPSGTRRSTRQPSPKSWRQPIGARHWHCGRWRVSERAPQRRWYSGGCLICTAVGVAPKAAGAGRLARSPLREPWPQSLPSSFTGCLKRAHCTCMLDIARS